jgi:hypothetical protein
MNKWIANISLLTIIKLFGLTIPLINSLIITPFIIPILFLIINFNGLLINNWKDNRIHNSLMTCLVFIMSILIDLIHFLYFNPDDPTKNIGLGYYLFFSIIPGCIILTIGLFYKNVKQLKKNKK